MVCPEMLARGGGSGLREVEVCPTGSEDEDGRRGGHVEVYT